MDSCTHPECNHVSGAAAQLFDGAAMRMVDLSEDTPGALPYGVTCSTQPVAGFQVQDPENSRWFQVNMWEIRSPDKIQALNQHAASVYAQADPEEDQPPASDPEPES